MSPQTRAISVSMIRLGVLAIGIIAALVFAAALIATALSVAGGDFSARSAATAGVAWIVALVCRQVVDASAPRKKLVEMELAEPDWASVVSELQEGETRLETHKGWLVTGTGSDPCELFLTDRRLFFRIAPFTLTPGGTAPIELADIKGCEVRPDGEGKPRLLVATASSHAPEALGAFAVDLRPADDPECWAFADRVMNAAEVRSLQIAHAWLAGEPAPLEEEWRQKSAYEVRLAELGSGPDEALIKAVREELGYGPFTPAREKENIDPPVRAEDEPSAGPDKKSPYGNLPGVPEGMKQIWAERDAKRQQGDTPS